MGGGEGGRGGGQPVLAGPANSFFDRRRLDPLLPPESPRKTPVVAFNARARAENFAAGELADIIARPRARQDHPIRLARSVVQKLARFLGTKRNRFFAFHFCVDSSSTRKRPTRISPEVKCPTAPTVESAPQFYQRYLLMQPDNIISIPRFSFFPLGVGFVCVLTAARDWVGHTSTTEASKGTSHSTRLPIPVGQ